MRHAPIDAAPFVENRQRLDKPAAAQVAGHRERQRRAADQRRRLAGDGANSDLFYLSGVEQEESILRSRTDAPMTSRCEKCLFLREPNERLKLWEGHKLSQDQAKRGAGIERVAWLSEFPGMLHAWMCEMEHVYLNSNEHKRADIQVETRDARFVAELPTLATPCTTTVGWRRCCTGCASSRARPKSL